MIQSWPGPGPAAAQPSSLHGVVLKLSWAALAIGRCGEVKKTLSLPARILLFSIVVEAGRFGGVAS